MFFPESMSASPCGARSRPSTTFSRYLIRPEQGAQVRPRACRGILVFGNEPAHGNPPIFVQERPHGGEHVAAHVLEAHVHAVGACTRQFFGDGIGDLRRAQTIVVAGWRDVEETPPAPLLDAIRRAADRGARLVSICTGAFVLAAAGVLDTLRATTHWRYVDRLRERYPKITVEPDVLYVDEGRILTSAGLDLCLHIVRCDHGAKIADAVARRLVVPTHREGGQAQFVPKRAFRR
ncbi:DJ-1/PfpI family protein [Pendulispora rubella]|uniref:DJ-1/PfpI family protein n=1 Tax=Pendulispora rubella TaxID=2741070 RepID=A0ABZ2L6D3_9BACT